MVTEWKEKHDIAHRDYCDRLHIWLSKIIIDEYSDIETNTITEEKLNVTNFGFSFRYIYSRVHGMF